MYNVYWAVNIIYMCIWRVRVAVIFYEDYLDFFIRDFTDFMVFRVVYVNLTKVGDGNVIRAALVSVRDTFTCHACMTFCQILKSYYLD